MANYGDSPGRHNMPPPKMPPPPQRPSATASVLTAVKLMYVGAVLSVVSLVIGLTQKDAIRKAVAARNPAYTAGQINTAANIFLVFGAVIGIIGLGLWLWMASANKKGYSWARVVSSVLFGINTLWLLYVLFARGNAAIQKVATLLLWLVGLGAVVFLWRSDSSAYFNAA